MENDENKGLKNLGGSVFKISMFPVGNVEWYKNTLLMDTREMYLFF